MNIPNSKEQSGFWEAYQACAEENRVASIHLSSAPSLGVAGIQHYQKRIEASRYSKRCKAPRPKGRRFPARWLFHIVPLAPALKGGACGHGPAKADLSGPDGMSGLVHYLPIWRVCLL